MSITHNDPNGAQIVKHSYNDSTNNIVEYLNSIDGQTSYDYDFLGQLIGADHANQTDESYVYDSNGNRITANGATYTTGTNNELTSDGDYTYTYDAEGNRTSKTNSAGTERELYTWDYRNRLTTVTKQTYDTTTATWTTVQIVEYAYDYNNVWIRKVVGNDKTIFIPENYQTTVQIDNGTTTHHYLWTPNQQDKLLADTSVSDVLWALTDHLGTVRDVLGDTSTHLVYDAFGNLISGTNPLLFGFTGKAFDTDTNLQNNINRWYDATTGRWLSTDPIGFYGKDLNLYCAVRNTPIIAIDSNGLLSMRFEINWRVTTSDEVFIHRFQVNVNFIYHCNKDNIPERDSYSTTGNYLGFTAQGPHHDELDSFGLSFLIVGVRSAITFEDDYRTEAISCTGGRIGLDIKVILTIKVMRDFYVGLQPGIGPLALDLGWDFNVSKEVLAEEEFEFYLRCCQCVDT